MRRTREAAVGQQTDFISEPFAMKGACNSEHLPHAGSASGSFITNDDDIAGLDLTPHDGLESILFALENAGGSFKPQNPHAGHLHHAAFGCEIAFQYA